jgi:hypothetical protein
LKANKQLFNSLEFWQQNVVVGAIGLEATTFMYWQLIIQQDCPYHCFNANKKNIGP